MTSEETADQILESNELLIARIGKEVIGLSSLLDVIRIKKNWHVIDEALMQILLEDVFKKNNISVSENEVQTKILDFRKENKLVTGNETRIWLEKHHMSDENLIQMCKFDLSLQKLKKFLFENQIEKYFVFKKQEFFYVEHYKIVIGNEEVAKEIVCTLKEGASFFDYARKYSQDLNTAKACGYVGKIALFKLSPLVQDLISKSKEGDIIGPVKVNKNYEIYLLEKFFPAVLDQEIYKQLENELFEQWLSNLRSHSQIEWLV